MPETSTESPTKLTHFQPEVAYSPEKKGSQTLELIADPKTGEIIKSGDPRDVHLWIEAERSRAETLGQKPVDLEKIHGGLLLPGMIDAHAHPFIYAGLELSDPVKVDKVKTKEALIGRLRAEVAKHPRGTFLVATELDTTKIKDLTAADLDKVSQDHKVVVYDPSYHSCVVNHVALGEIDRFTARYQDLAKTRLRGQRTADGLLTEDHVYMTWEMIELEGGVEQLVEKTEKGLDQMLSQGITGVHDMEIGTYPEVIAYLMLAKKKGAKMPVRQIYLQPRTLKYVEAQVEDLKDRGFSIDDLKSKLTGFKLYSDGAFGSHTALMRDPYVDEGGRGHVFQRMDQLNRALKEARELGLENIGIHAIGDKGIQRAVELAKSWVRMGEKEGFDPTKFRIEHFGLPTPYKRTLGDVKDLGIWVCEQPNFLSDYKYEDRLGKRVTLVCPHREILNYDIPMMFGADGMPTSALFGIWIATHAPEEWQRLSFEEALFAYGLATGRYEGKNVGSLETGQEANIVVADPKLLDDLLSSEIRDPREKIVAKDKLETLEANIRKVMFRGEFVSPKAA